MKVLMINSVSGIRSTGRICTDIAEVLIQQGHECKIAYGREDVPKKYRNISVRIGDEFGVKLHGLRSRIFDDTGFGSRRATERFIAWVKEYNPDVIHLHNLHGYYLNIEVLFKYLETADKPVIWTLHDCWAFTGHCTYFDFVGCDKWQTHCKNCPNKKDYPKSILFDRSYKNYDDKKHLFTSVKNMTIVTPSRWLAGLVKQSFLREYPVQVIYNGIDLAVFKPTPSDFRQRYHLEDKQVILAVASIWDKRKGYGDLLKLVKFLEENQRLVIVGVSNKQQKTLPSNVIGILRTNSPKELAQIYTAADVFVNPTYEETFGMVNIEALACGTPVITYNTGGSPESIDSKTGIVLDRKSINELSAAVNISKSIKPEQCINRSKLFDEFICSAKYAKLYANRY